MRAGMLAFSVQSHPLGFIFPETCYYVQMPFSTNGTVANSALHPVTGTHSWHVPLLHFIGPNKPQAPQIQPPRYPLGWFPSLYPHQHSLNPIISMPASPSTSHLSSLLPAHHTILEWLPQNSAWGLSLVMNFCLVFDMNCCSLWLKGECTLQMSQAFHLCSHLAFLDDPDSSSLGSVSLLQMPFSLFSLSTTGRNSSYRTPAIICFSWILS